MLLWRQRGIPCRYFRTGNPCAPFVKPEKTPGTGVRLEHWAACALDVLSQTERQPSAETIDPEMKLPALTSLVKPGGKTKNSRSCRKQLNAIRLFLSGLNVLKLMIRLPCFNEWPIYYRIDGYILVLRFR